MPIPFLIGGLVAAAAAAAAAYALSDDDKSNDSNDSDDAERRLKEAAEKERKKRERTQKREAAVEDFRKQGRIFGNDLAKVLPTELVGVRSRDSFTLDFDLKKGNLNFDMEEAARRDAHLFATIDSLENIINNKSMCQKIIENLVLFSEVYKPEFHYGAALREKELRVLCIDEDIDALQKIKKQIIRL